jgi:hypothetical protein
MAIVCWAMLLLLPSIASGETNSTPIAPSEKKIIPSRSFPCNNSSEELNIAGWTPVKLKQIWCGQVSQELRSAVPKRGYITNHRDWTRLWQTYRSDEKVPRVNFDRELILVYVHTDSNTVYMSPMLNTKGDLANNISFTEVASSNSSCTYKFGSIDRREIKTIAGKAIGNK